jgi:prepilin peptidase CpaA
MDGENLMPDAASLIDGFALFVLTAALIAAALSDAATYLIPNRYAAIIVLAFVPYAIGKPIEFSLHGLAVGGLMLVGGAILFARGMFGGGDVKLLAATGLWAGSDQIILLLFASAIAGGVLALAQLSPLRHLLPARPGGGPIGSDLRSQLRQPMPFGVAVAFGGVCVALARLVS